jgi:hypothetical protein
VERAISDGSHVHRVLLDGVGAQLFPCNLVTSTPQSFLVTSWSAHTTDFGVAVCPKRADGVRCCPTHIHQIRVGLKLEGVQPLIHLRYAFPSCLPGPSRLAVPTRPVVVRAAFRPSLRFQGQAALSFTGLLRQAGGAGLSLAHSYTEPRGALLHFQGALLLVWITALATAILPGKEGFYADADTARSGAG